jgi:hypothetical protein
LVGSILGCFFLRRKADAEDVDVVDVVLYVDVVENVDVDVVDDVF